MRDPIMRDANAPYSDPLTCLSVTRSVSSQKWVMRCDAGDVDAFAQSTGLTHIQAALMAGRDIDSASVEHFLNPRLRDSLIDPSLLKDMDKAVYRILDGIEKGERICIFSDYDVDGGTSAAQLIRWGAHIGFDFTLYIPDRVKEGYGPSKAAFEDLKAQGADLIITLDCGAAAHEALHAASDLELPVIVIDHHLMESIPPAYALVNPNRPDDSSQLGHLAAAGLSFMLVVALNRQAKQRGMPSLIDPKSLLGLTALGTICDVVPLKGLNRSFVHQGLKVLSRNDQAGVKALADIAQIMPPFSVYDCGFVLGPRLNAGGRIGRSDMGAELLATENMQLAYSHATELDRVNQERRTLQAQMMDEALPQATRQAQQQDQSDILIVSMTGWHPGIIGIIAGRLKDQFSAPAIVLSIDEAGLVKGSARSIEGVNIGAAFSRAKAQGLIKSGGGHAMAGGLTLEAHNIEAFSDFIRADLSQAVKIARADKRLKIDAALSVSAVNFELLEIIDEIGPYGAQHPQPRFAFADMRLSYSQRLKGNHIRFNFEDSHGQRLSGICFRADEKGLSDILLGSVGENFHVCGQIKRNQWQGKTRIDFHLDDVAKI